MNTINIYKITDLAKFKKNISKKNKKYDKGKSKIEKLEEDNSEFHMTLYYYIKNEKQLNWEWVLKAFDKDLPDLNPEPNAIILIEEKKEKGSDFYAATFGQSFHEVQDCVDDKWAFDFAEKTKYENIKEMTLITPNSYKYKQINNYSQYNEFDLDGSSALTSIQAYLEFDENLNQKDSENKDEKSFDDLFNHKISISNSVHFNIKNNDLKSLALFIKFINKTIAGEKRYNLPRMRKIKSKSEKEKYDKKLKNDFLKYLSGENIEITFSENITYNNELDSINKVYNFSYQYENEQSEVYPSIYIDDLSNFLKDNFMEKINDKSLNLFEIQVNIKNENMIVEDLKKFILYVAECKEGKEKDDLIILWDGEWYVYNQEYVNYIQDSLNKLNIIYDEDFDIPNSDFIKFIEDKLPIIKEKDEEKNNERKMDYDDPYKNVNECFFNKFVSHKWKCDNYDRKNKLIKGLKNHKIEIMDLYNKGECCAVKIGGPNNFNYVIDQSLMSLKYLDSNDVEFDNEINTFSLWLIYNKNKLQDIDGRPGVPNLNCMRSIIFKTKLAQWEREVRDKKYIPVIRFNYKNL